VVWVANSDCVLVFSLVDWGGTEVPAALGGCVQYRGHLRGGTINRVIPYTVQRLGLFLKGGNASRIRD
jgi:hypothetical protein